MHHHLLFIEPDSARRELLHSVLAKESSSLDYCVVSSDEEARSQFDNASPALVFAAENDRTKQDGYRKKSSQLSHSLRGPLSVILNAAFLLKRKGTKDDVVLEKYLTIIEQQAEAVERMLSDHLRSVF